MSDKSPTTIQADDIWVSQPELCRRLGMSRSTVTRLRRRGLPHVGHDRLRRYHLPSVLQWLSQQT
jgi:biotin operon repressor